MTPAAKSATSPAGLSGPVGGKATAMTKDISALIEREFRKTATIRASQWFKMGDHPAVVNSNFDRPWIDTLEGGHLVTPGDWIATDVKGEHWPIKPDVFAATYEPVDPLTSPPDTESVERGEANYREWRKSLEAVQEEDCTVEDLATCAHMLEEYVPEALPANERGQVPMVRSMTDATASTIRGYLAALRTSTPATEGVEDIAADIRRDVNYAMACEFAREMRRALGRITEEYPPDTTAGKIAADALALAVPPPPTAPNSTPTGEA